MFSQMIISLSCSAGKKAVEQGKFCLKVHRAFIMLCTRMDKKDSQKVL